MNRFETFQKHFLKSPNAVTNITVTVYLSNASVVANIFVKFWV